jgi:hypothetical protein
MLTHYKPNATGTRIAVTRLSPRRAQLGTIHRTAKGDIFVPRAKRLTIAQLHGLLLYIQGLK